MNGADLAEIESVYRERFDVFVRTAGAVLGDVEAGRDAVQEAFAAAVRKRSTFRGEAPLEAWLWRIVLNEARSGRRRRRVPAAEATASWNGSVLGAEDAALRLAVAALPERQRLAVFLRYYADLDHASIAAALGVQPGTVGATLNHAHATLRRHLEEVLT
jgi:RNA polymerase sigma-70 factor, ECF subfamily